MSGSASKKGVGMLINATKSGLSMLTVGGSKARKSYANKNEKSVLAELRKKSLSPADCIFEALRKVYFLYMAGYKHEVVAAGLQAGKRLTDFEKITIPIDAVTAFGHSVCDECLKYGDFEKGTFYQSMRDFLNTARMGKENLDRDSLVHDIFYAILYVVETNGTEWQSLQQVFREAAARVIGDAVHISGTSDARKKAAKGMHLFASQIKTCAQESETKRQKALKDAEKLLRKEQERQHSLQGSHETSAQ